MCVWGGGGGADEALQHEPLKVDVSTNKKHPCVPRRQGGGRAYRRERKLGTKGRLRVRKEEE